MPLDVNVNVGQGGGRIYRGFCLSPRCAHTCLGEGGSVVQSSRAADGRASEHLWIYTNVHARDENVCVFGRLRLRVARTDTHMLVCLCTRVFVAARVYVKMSHAIVAALARDVHFFFLIVCQ